MPGNTDEKEKCLKKLSEMQQFLPFLDFMIDKIREKNDLPLECQLSKFQHIRSVIIEKNGKYSLESLINIEDILQKLITKLDYKGIYPKDKKDSLRVKPQSLKLTQGGRIKRESIPIDVPETATSPSTAKSAQPSTVQPPRVPSKAVDSPNNTAGMIMKSMKMTADHGYQQDDIKEVISKRNDGEKDSEVAETAGIIKNFKYPCEKSKELEEVRAARTSPRKDTEYIKSCAPTEMLTSSREKFFTTVPGRECEAALNKKAANTVSIGNMDSFGSDLKGTKPIEGKAKNRSISGIFSNCELSDISDDDYIIAEDIESNSDRSKNRELKNVKHSANVSLPKKEITTKPDCQLNESPTSSISNSVNDISSKQKLRERLSADIAEVHKVPGKSVGGSLRSLKDLKNYSHVRDTGSEPQQKKSHAKDRKTDHYSDSFENSSDSERDHDSKKSSRREWRNKDCKSRDRERRRDEKHHHKSEDEREERPVHGTKHSNRSERKLIRFEEKKKRRKKRLEIDRLDDAELVAFVKENISDLPYLSKLNPEELRRAARSSLARENIDSDTDEMDEETEISGKRPKENRSRSISPGADTEVKARQTDTNDDDDEYSIRLIEELSPISKTRLEPEKPEVLTKLSVPEMRPGTNSNPAENRDARTSHSVQSSELLTESHSQMSHRSLKSLKSRTESAVSPRYHNPLNDRGNCDPRKARYSSERCEEQQLVKQHLPSQRFPTYDRGSNNSPIHQESLSDDAIIIDCGEDSDGSGIRQSNYGAYETKTYGDCKILKNQGKEKADQLIPPADDRVGAIEGLASEEPNPELRIKQVRQNESEVMIKKSLSSLPSNKLKPCHESNSKIRSSKTTNTKISVDTNQRILNCKSDDDQPTEKFSVEKLSSSHEEQVLHLEKCREYSSRNLKFPESSQISLPNKQKTDVENSQLWSCSTADKPPSSNELQIESQSEAGQECNDFKVRGTCKKGDVTSSDQSVSDHIQEGNAGEADITKNRKASEIIKETFNKCASLVDVEEDVTIMDKNISHDQISADKEKDNEKLELNKKIIEEKESGRSSEKLKLASVVDEEKRMINTKTAGNKTENFTSYKNNLKISSQEGGSSIKPRVESDSGSKSTITEEITQELVEALISKSFESGEGELLLAKAKLFKELALKLNSKKLKTIQKIINSESDSSSSSSGSSTESEKRKKKKTKKKNSEEAGKAAKKNKKEKKTVKSKRYVDASSESEYGMASHENGVCESNLKEVQSESVKDRVENEEFSHGPGEPSTKSKKNQRKTKLLEQIFNESPAQNFELSMDNQAPPEKESEQKSKVKGKSRGKTELDRLHEDVRNMFISSGVVTATGQRMCRILRESGGKMNNLDLVKESAKMVEEEKLASRKGKKLSKTRSRSRSVDRKTLRDRSSTAVLTGAGLNISKALKNRAVVLLKRINLEKMSYAYKITTLPESLTRKRGRNVARRGRGRGRGLVRGMTKSATDEEIYLNKMGRIYLARNLRKSLMRRSKSRKRIFKKKLTDIIQKLPLKMAKIRHLEIGSKEAQERKSLEEQVKQNETVDKKFKTEYRVEESSEILEYAFDKTKSAFSCLLCGFHTKSITAHYKNEHPDSEVLISRLENSEAMKAIQDSKEFNYDITTLEQACSLEIIKRRVKNKLSGSTTFFCRMCNYGNVTNICQFYSHVSTHTGEYRFRCPVEGCDLTMTYRESIRNHIISKHPKHKLPTNKALELFPLPSEHGILFGYLCSRCNFVQVLKRNIESHIQRVHGGVQDVRAIKIDMSGKAPVGKRAKRRAMRRKTNNRELDDEEDGVKRKNEEDGEFEDHASDNSQSNDDEGEVEFEDPGDEDYMYESDVASDSCPSNDSDENYSGSGHMIKDDKYQPRRTRSSALNDQTEQKRDDETIGNCTSETPNANKNEANDLKSVSKQDKTTVKSEVLTEEEEADVSGTVGHKKKWIVGPLEATVLKNDVTMFNCCLGQCCYKTQDFISFERHVLTSHESAVWTGVCESCDIPTSQKQGSLPGIYKISDVWDHMANHIISEMGGFTIAKIENIKKELLQSSMDMQSSKQSEREKGEISSKNLPYPKKPLLRVRSLMGDRLSKPKSWSEEELSQSESPKTMTGSVDEHDKISSEPFFTIKDVRSLNPNTENDGADFPPNAEVIAGKPVLIRSCPSPKITISSEPDSPIAIPLPVAQAKPGVEVGQLMKVFPQPKVSEVPSPLDLNQLGFVTTTSIRILSPGTTTAQAVIIPTFTTASRLKALPKTVDSAQSVTLKESMKCILKPILSKAIMTPITVGSDVVIQQVEKGVTVSKKKSPKKKKSSQTSSISTTKPILVSEVGNTAAGDSSPAPVKGEQHYSMPISGRNIKDAKIYSQMLTKKKLCQLFKCMAIECSFTCNNETIFTQHLGLHEAQQRIKGKKRPLNKVKKIFNWQQCAYCCEVLVHTGSALSQHILTEHGHCLYQCAYCFYRAISPTYVDLHQNTVHEKIIKEMKKLIYKCKPIPGTVMSKQFEKQIKPQHIRPYQCEHCGSKFLIIQHFLDHLTEQHQSVTAYTCHICKIPCFKVDRLIAHYKLHSYSMYQCAYCLHGTENEKEMLYHLWNFHFSQPPVIYARILEDQTKTDNVALDDLKLLTFDNEPTEGEHNLEEAGSEAEQEMEKKDTESVSVDLSAIVSELGINVDDVKKSSAAKTGKEIESSLTSSLTLETMLPNAQFSSESDAGNGNSTLLISSALSSVIGQEKEERDASVPIGQLPIEVLERFHAESSQKEAKGEKNESVDKIILNLQQKNSSVSVSPVVEHKVKEEAAPIRTLHKLPPTVPVSRSIITSVYPSKKVAIVKKLDECQTKEGAPLLFHQLCSTPRISTDLVQPQGVIVAVPVVDTVKNPCYIQGKDDTGTPSLSRNLSGMKRTAEDSPDTLKSVSDGSILKRLCLGNTSTPAVFTIRPVQESSLRISDVRSLSTGKTSPVLLQPPVIRVEDFAEKREVLGDSMKPIEIEKNKLDPGQEKNVAPPPSPEVIILEPEEDGKSCRNELVDVVDSEDDDEVKKESNEEKTKKMMTNNDLEIRKQMERLRNQIENETDCLLLDDVATQYDNGESSQLKKSEDSRSRSTNEETINSITFDSQHPSEESSDKAVPGEGNTQDVDSRANDSEDSKSSRLDEWELSNEKCDGLKAEKLVGEPDKKQELSGKDLYLCGNGNCNFSAATDVELKDHLYVCDFSRESTTLVCPHCSKHFKHSPPFVEHLKIHGEKKYSCGLCDLRSPWESIVTRHLKHKHKFSQLKILPHDSKPGHFVVYPKNYKKEKQNVEMNLYSPGDEDKLPLQSIYQENVNCAKCPYFTKVRSNMVRHLKIHIKSVEAEGSIIVPSTAPTNPVPCLDTKERMFDKMTNLAASSQLAQANKDKLETLSPEEEAKLPQFVPEQMRHKCCSPDCNYLTIDDNMLKHHIRALHDEINVYSCPHCRETVHLEFRFVPLDKIGQHLKYHDTRLYKCYHCTYFHYQKYVVEKHALEKHPERRFFVFTVREPKMDSNPAVEEEQHNSSSCESVTKMWKCGFCDNCESSVRMTVIEHLAKVHNTKSKYKCKFCDMKSSQVAAFAAHFASKHNGQKVECMKALIQVNKSVSEGRQSAVRQEASSDHFDTTPLWQRDAPRIRHIRGILIEEEEIKTKKTKKISSDIENEVKTPASRPTDIFFCPLCTDKKKVFRSKSAEAFRTHLYQELNYHQFACILCGKMFVDRKECERHHVRTHPNRTLSMKQTKEDSEIKFWVDKVVAKQQAQIMERKRSISDALEESSTAKKKKVQTKAVLLPPIAFESPKKKAKTNKPARVNNSSELNREMYRGKAKRRSKEDKSEFVRQTRSGSAVHSTEPLKKCPHCQYKVYSLNNLKTHIKLRHLKMGKWLCPYCGESFQLEKDATKHCRSSHPDEVPQAAPNPDEQVGELKDDFWLVEYGFGRENQTKRVTDGEKPSERYKLQTAQEKVIMEITKSSGTTKQMGSENNSVCSCGYCMLKVADQNSIIEHFETHHKDIHSETHGSIAGTIYYQCSICSEKLLDFDSLDVHAKDKHQNMTFQFEIRKVYKHDSKEYPCMKCLQHPCECSKSSRTEADNAKDGCYQCPRCPVISISYLDCIDHFNEHYPRYACSNCTLRFFTEKEIEEHQNQYKHKSPYSMTIPSENMLEEYKLGVKVKRNGIWVPLKANKRSNNSSDDPKETKKAKSLTARKSTTQVPDRRSHAEVESHEEETKVSNSEQIQRDLNSQSHSELPT